MKTEIARGCPAQHRAYISSMADRFVHVTFSSPAKRLEQTLTVDEAASLLEQNVPQRELQETLAFLEIERMAEGYYRGSDWSVSFRVINPGRPTDLAEETDDSTSAE